VPTYEYECTACGQHIEVFQRIAEDPLTTCGVCGGPLRKVFHPAGIVFKGSGFYTTDSRSGKGTSGAGSGSGSEAKGAEAKGAEAKGAGGRKPDGAGAAKTPESSAS
jgi:putative FmdB family regulatory protein